MARFGAAVVRRRASAVEDQIKPELELLRVVVVGLERVLDDHLGEVRVLVGGELTQDALRERRTLLRGMGRQIHLLQREAIDVAVHDRERVSGHGRW